MGRWEIELTERGWIPDSVIRMGIRYLLKKRLTSIYGRSVESACVEKERFIAAQKIAPIALETERANVQHYEVPAEFFNRVLGERLKYSCGLWVDEDCDLDRSEHCALEDTCRFARLSNGQQILELGCGWGSLTLWMAERYPDSKITAVSNSQSQAQHIREHALNRGFGNVEVITCDMNDFEITHAKFDRIVSVEMFEHMRNYDRLYGKVADWLAPGGLFFKHIFVHRSAPYAFEVVDSTDWMSEHFFSGGMMPSDDLPARFQRHLDLVDHQIWDGRHYEKTSNAWLAKMDAQRASMMQLLADIYGEKNARTWWWRWRLFFMACAELFGYRDGQEWWVSHYLFEKKAP